MPVYTTQCQACHSRSSVKLTFAAYDEVKAGGSSLSCSCGGAAELVFDPGAVNFVLKDGESGGWVSKAGKENAYRAKRREVMAKRERDHVFKSKLQPNFDGQLTESWKGAQEIARDVRYEEVRQEHDAGIAQTAATEAAKTYDSLVRREVSSTST
jgi:hypothetical protein